MKKLNTKYLLYALAIIGVAGALLVYYFVYLPTQEKTNQLERQTRDLKSKIEELQIISASMDEYEEKMVVMQQEVEELQASFSEYYQMEDALMYAYDMIFDVDYVNYNSITEYAPELLYSIPVQGGTANYDLYSKKFDFGVKTTYQGMKDLIQCFYDSETVKKIDDLDFSFDEETGLLEGTISFEQFFLTETEKPYVDPYIPEIPMGTENIFGETAVGNAEQYKELLKNLLDEALEEAE